MLDHQARSDATGFQHNGEAGKLIHGLLGWDKLIPESMAMYQAGRPTFRLTSKPEPEARMWMLDGFAGGIQPWWHHVGAYQEDRRMLSHRRTRHALARRKISNTSSTASPSPPWAWSGRSRTPISMGATMRKSWSNCPGAAGPMRWSRAGFPICPSMPTTSARDADQFSVLILPEPRRDDRRRKSQAVRQFVERGGSLIATGQSSRCNEWGEPRADFALADLFGAHVVGKNRRFRR